MAEIDLNEADEGIVDHLREGRNTPSNLARHLDYSREYVSQRLKRLTEHNVVERVDRGLYELVDDPGRSEAPRGDETPPEDDVGASPPPDPADGLDDGGEDDGRDVRDQLREELSGSGDLLERRVDELLEMYEALRELGEAEKDDLLAAVDVEATGYETENSVWSNMVKGRDTLRALPGVQKPGVGRTVWTYTGDE